MRVPFHSAFALLFVCQSECLKILIYQATFGHSHVNFVAKVADALANAEHSVLLLQPVINSQLQAGTTHKVEVLRLESTPEIKQTFSVVDEHTKVRWSTPFFHAFSMMTMMSQFASMNRAVCKGILYNETLIANLKAQHFDIALTQPFDTCGLGLIHHLGIEKYIVLLSTPMFSAVGRILGATTGVSYIPEMYSANSEHMNLWQRTKNTLAYMISGFNTRQMLESLDGVVRELDPSYPGALQKVVDACFLMPNSEPLFDFPRPSLQKIVNIGGISVPPASTSLIPKDLSDALELREYTIFVSFGSLAKSIDMPAEYKHGLVSAMKRFPNVTFIWKYENPADTAVKQGAENIVLMKWVPQADLLCDRRLTAFITHGGAGSINELVVRGKKAIAIPQFGDQQHNAQMAARHGSVKIVAKHDLANGDVLAEAIEHLITNHSMDEAAERLATMIQNRPFSPQEQLVRYTEFAAKYGPFATLDPYGRQLSFFSYFFLDVVSALVICVALFGTCAVYVTRRCIQGKHKID